MSANATFVWHESKQQANNKKRYNCLFVFLYLAKWYISYFLSAVCYNKMTKWNLFFFFSFSINNSKLIWQILLCLSNYMTIFQRNKVALMNKNDDFFLLKKANNLHLSCAKLFSNVNVSFKNITANNSFKFVFLSFYLTKVSYAFYQVNCFRAHK